MAFEPLWSLRERAERVSVFEVADSVSHSAFLRVAVRKHVASGGNDDNTWSCWRVNVLDLSLYWTHTYRRRWDRWKAGR